MRTLIILSVFLSAILNTVKAQVGKSIENVKLIDVTNAPKSLPYVSEKVFALFYIDPDVQDINDPLNDALNAKKFPKTEFRAVGISDLLEAQAIFQGVKNDLADAQCNYQIKMAKYL